MEARLCMYASVNWAFIGSGNGWFPCDAKTIHEPKSTQRLFNKFQWNLHQGTKIFIWEKVFKMQFCIELNMLKIIHHDKYICELHVLDNRTLNSNIHPRN